MRGLFAHLLVSAALAGNNGLALTPPLSWRSWNAFNWRINELTALTAARGLVDTSRAIVGRPAGASLASLGYASVGIDEGWAQCIPKGTSPDGWEFHERNADGSISPLVNRTLFPDMKGLVERIHAMNLSAGWYLNPCFSYCWELCVRARLAPAPLRAACRCCRSLSALPLLPL